MVFSTLISVQDLAEQLDHPDLLIVDCRFELARPAAGREYYQELHIPGAYFADLDQDLSGKTSPTRGRHPLPDEKSFIALLHRWSVTDQTQVVAYDAEGGAMAAARLWWLLRAYGHAGAAVLDGGLPAWLQAGYAVNDIAPRSRKPSDTAFSIHPEWMVNSSEMEKIVLHGEHPIVDARSFIRYQGLEEVIDVSAGHIPGAVSLPYGICLNPDGTFKSREELQKIYASLPGTYSPEAAPVFYCGSGVTSVIHVLGMLHAGCERALLYPGSWSEWIRDPSHAIAVK